MSEEVKKKQPLPWWRRILLVLVLMAIMLLAALMLTGYIAERQLGAEIVKISQADEPITFLDFQADSNQSSTSNNAAGYYTEALSGIDPNGLRDLMYVNTFYRKNIISLPVSQFPADMREKVTQNLTYLQPALEKFDRAADLPLSDFDIGIEEGMQVCRTRLRRVQTAVFLLSLRTMNFILGDKDDTAVDSTITMLKMTRVFDSYPTMVLYAAKAPFVNHTCQDICLLLGYGQPSEKALAKLQKVLSQATATNILERVFLAERIYQIEMGRNLISKNIASRFLQDRVPDLPERLSLPASRWGRLRIRQNSTRFLRDMAWLIAAARQGWPQSLDAIVDRCSNSVSKCSGLISNAANCARLTAELLAVTRCAELAVAIERYHRSHGELPASLDDILPAYIDSVPSDPFTGRELLYKRNEDSYLVYSTGINRSDDGGSIIRRAYEKSPQDCGLCIRFRAH